MGEQLFRELAELFVLSRTAIKYRVINWNPTQSIKPSDQEVVLRASPRGVFVRTSPR